MSGKKSKNKGKLFEREIANFLSDLYDESFTRVPYSGAFVGGKNAVRKEHLDEAQIRGFKSDIIPPAEWSRLNVECKHYAEFPFHALLRSKDIPLLDQWIAQTYDAADDGDFNLIIMKFNRLGRFVMFEKEASTRKVGQQVHLVTSYHYAYYKDWIMMDFDTFWFANKSLVKELSQR
jgi:hypothetical protein